MLDDTFHIVSAQCALIHLDSINSEKFGQWSICYLPVSWKGARRPCLWVQINSNNDSTVSDYWRLAISFSKEPVSVSVRCRTQIFFGMHISKHNVSWNFIFKNMRRTLLKILFRWNYLSGSFADEAIIHNIPADIFLFVTKTPRPSQHPNPSQFKVCRYKDGYALSAFWGTHV